MPNLLALTLYDDIRQVRDIRVDRRTASGRVGQLTIALAGPDGLNAR